MRSVFVFCFFKHLFQTSNRLESKGSLVLVDVQCNHLKAAEHHTIHKQRKGEGMGCGGGGIKVGLSVSVKCQKLKRQDSLFEAFFQLWWSIVLRPSQLLKWAFHSWAQQRLKTEYAPCFSNMTLFVGNIIDVVTLVCTQTDFFFLFFFSETRVYKKKKKKGACAEILQSTISAQGH